MSDDMEIKRPSALSRGDPRLPGLQACVPDEVSAMGIEIEGLSALLRDDPRRDGPRVWVPEETSALRIEELALVLRYRGVEYRASIAGTKETAKRTGFRRVDGEWRGWAAELTEQLPRGKRIMGVSSLPTLEAAIVAAISLAYVADYQRSGRDVPGSDREE